MAKSNHWYKMENSAYVPGSGHISSPALVVFSQAAGGLTEALRIQRPFNPQLTLTDTTSKDLHRPFMATGLSLRHMEAYNSLPAHLLHHLQPQFLHPSLSLGSGAFRPLADLKAFPSPSAFGPPKCLKIETNNGDNNGMLVNSHGHSIFSPSEDRFVGSQTSRTDSCSPASVSLSPPPSQQHSHPGQPSALGHVKEESLDAHMSEDGDGGNQTPGPSNCDRDVADQSPVVHEENRGFRLGPLFGGGFGGGGYAFTVSGHGPGPGQGMPPDAHTHAKNSFLFENAMKKKRDPSCCPVCGMSVTQGELETHFLHELERLYKLSSSNAALSAKQRRHEMQRPPSHPGDSGPDGRWETFQRIKTNRQGRLRIKMRKRKADESCPMCIGRVHRSPDDHTEQCLRKGGISIGNDEDETVDVEGDSEFEEWTTAQRRLQPDQPGPQFTSTITTATCNTSIRSVVNDPQETEDLIVDGDEPEETTQFNNQDTVVVMDDGAKEQSSKYFSPDGVQSQVATSSGDVEVKVESGPHCDSNVTTSDAEPSSRAQVLEDLKNRIRQLEAEAGGETATSTQSEDFKCLICLEHYKKPVISTVCWHVHCEECWLHTLSTKKVCPQCSMIITPSDLRRIFM